MTTKRLAGLWILAVGTTVFWLVAADMASPTRIVAELQGPARVVSVIFGATVLAVSSMRIRAFANERGSVSLMRTGAVVLAAIAAVFLAYNRGGSLTHHVCEYVVWWFVLAYVFLVILRSEDRE